MTDVCCVELHRNPRSGFALYAFLCPGCGGYEVGGCPQTVSQLQRCGVREHELRDVSAPALTVDDLLDLSRWLDTDPSWRHPSGP